MLHNSKHLSAWSTQNICHWLSTHPNTGESPGHMPVRDLPQSGAPVLLSPGKALSQWRGTDAPTIQVKGVGSMCFCNLPHLNPGLLYAFEQ